METAAFLAACGSIFALAFFHFWSAIPAGIALNLSPVLVILIVVASYMTGAAVILFLGGPIRARFMRRFEARMPEQDTAIYRIWQRWGVQGFGLLAPITLGSQLAAIFGLALQMDVRRLFISMLIGAIVWSVIIMLAVQLGIAGVEQVVTSPAS